jgi:hypothetical protein
VWVVWMTLVGGWSIPNMLDIPGQNGRINRPACPLVLGAVLLLLILIPAVSLYKLHCVPCLPLLPPDALLHMLAWQQVTHP